MEIHPWTTERDKRSIFGCSFCRTQGTSASSLFKAVMSRYFSVFFFCCFEMLKLFSHPLYSKNNEPVLLFNTIFRHWSCLLSSVVTDGKDGRGLTLEQVGPTFSSFNAMRTKITKKNYKGLELGDWKMLDIFSVTLQEDFVYGQSRQVMSSEQNWPKTAISSWHSLFKLSNREVKHHVYGKQQTII